MDVENKDFYKTIEVIWSRNRNTHRSKLLPEMKEINIDDSVKKVKISRLDKFSRSFKMNENGIELAHKCVKKKLFQENKSEKVSSYSSMNNLNKKHCEAHLDNFTATSQIILERSPQIISNREKFRRKNSKRRLLQKESPNISKTVEYSPLHSINDTSVIKSSCIVNQRSRSNLLPDKSPEIMSNRKQQCIENKILAKMNSNESAFSDLDKLNKKYCKTHPHNLTELSQNSLIKSPPILSSREKLKKNKFKQCLFQKESPKILKTVGFSPLHLINDTSVIKSSCIVNQTYPSSSNLLQDKSPEIISNRKRQYIEDTFLAKMNANESAFSDLDKLNKKYCKTHPHNLTELSQNSLTKSSPIVSSREKLMKNKFKQRLFQQESSKILKTVKYSSLHSINDTSVIKSSCIVNQTYSSSSNLLQDKSPEIMSNRKRQCIEDTILEKSKTNESAFSDSDKLNEKYCETHSHNLTEISQNSLIKMTNTVECSPLKSVVDTSIIKSLCHLNQIHPSTSNLFYNKSPEIVSNRKRQYKLLEKMDFSNNTLTMNYRCAPQASKMLNKKSELSNTHRSKVKLKSNFEDIEDIIESSEVIHLANKKKRKEKKNSTDKKKGIRNNTFRNITHELKSTTDEKNEVSKKNVFITEKIIKNELSDDINDSIDIINTENILMPVEMKIKKKSPRKKPKKFIDKFKVDNKVFKPQRANKKDKSVSVTHLPSEISLIPATPERPEYNEVIIDKPVVECSSETIMNSYIPQIEVDKSPRTPHDKNCQVLIQTTFTPPNVQNLKLPVLFESVVSPTQSFISPESSFKIDSVESPSAVHEYDNFFSPERTKKKSDNSPSPNCFDSAKKRKKVCKDGLRGKFRELINRKKSEACIREYEKNVSTNHQLKHYETTLLKVIDVWKDFRTFILLCYYMKSETQVQKVIVTLDNCPKNATKDSVIRIYSPWLTIESKITEIVLFVGVIHAEVIEFSGSNKSLGPTGLFTNINGLLTTIFQSEVKWKCNCSEETACQCLGESSVYNYLQFMISH